MRMTRRHKKCKSIHLCQSEHEISEKSIKQLTQFLFWMFCFGMEGILDAKRGTSKCLERWRWTGRERLDIGWASELLLTDAWALRSAESLHPRFFSFFMKRKKYMMLSSLTLRLFPCYAHFANLLIFFFLCKLKIKIMKEFTRLVHA